MAPAPASVGSGGHVCFGKDYSHGYSGGVLQLQLPRIHWAPYRIRTGDPLFTRQGLYTDGVGKNPGNMRKLGVDKYAGIRCLGLAMATVTATVDTDQGERMDRREEAIEKALDAAVLAADNMGANEGVSDSGVEKIARDAIAAYEAHMRHEVTTVEELDALPLGTVVVDSAPDVWERRGLRTPKWYSNDVEGSYISAELELPARVLYETKKP